MKLLKEDFKKKYGYSNTTYHRRVNELRNTSIFSVAYDRITHNEVRIDTDIYDQFLSYKAANRSRTRKMDPEEFLRKRAVERGLLR